MDLSPDLKSDIVRDLIAHSTSPHLPIMLRTRLAELELQQACELVEGFLLHHDQTTAQGFLCKRLTLSEELAEKLIAELCISIKR